jgi:hypothetical protein
MTLPEEQSKIDLSSMIKEIINESRLSVKLWKSLFFLRQLEASLYDKLECKKFEDFCKEIIDNSKLMRMIHFRESLSESMDASLYFDPNSPYGEHDFYAFEEDLEKEMSRIQDIVTSELAKIFKFVISEAYGFGV